MAIAHWDIDPDSWDTLKLGKSIMPGLWTVTYTIERKLDVKKAGGSDGARFKDKGDEPTSLTLTGRLVTEEDWTALQEAFQQIFPKKGKERFALSIVHPATRFAGIDLIYIHKVNAPELRDGELSISIECLEYIKPVKVPKAKAPVSNSSGSFISVPPDGLAVFPGMRSGVLDE